jgi:F-type H+-transporting ATPase subunit b
MILLVLLWVFYALLVHRPLKRVLGERRSRTEGAVEKARADTLEAEARTAEYEQRWREARAAAFRAQEERRKHAIELRMSLIAGARAKAQEKIEQAKAAIEKDKVVAQAALQAESARLASEIASTVLSPASQAPAGGR